MKKSYGIIFALTCAATLNAQEIIKPTYNYPISNTIETMESAPGGMLLIGSSDGLTAIEAHQSEVRYQYNKMGKLKPEEVSLIPNTPYVILTRGYSKVLLNYLTGQEVFNSSQGGWTSVMHVKADFNANRILMMGTTTSGYTLASFDMENMENKGLATFSDKKTMGAYVNLSKYWESDGKLFVRTEKGMVCVDKETFKTDWVYADLEKTSGIIDVIADAAKGEYFIAESNGKDHYLHRLDATGKRTTKKPTKLAGMPQRMLFTDKGLFSHSADLKTTYIQLFDRSTCTGIWKKPFEIDGAIFLTEITATGIVFAAQNGRINTIDFTSGKEVIKKDIKTGPMFQNVSLLPEDKVFFLTIKDMGIADLRTGEYTKEPAKFKKVTHMVTAYDSKNDNLVVSTGTELYFIKKDGTSKKITDILFKEDETPNKIEFRESGILISASQNAMLVSYDGLVKYQSYYKAPGQSVAAKIALGALTAAAATAGHASTEMGYGKRNDNMQGANGAMNEMNKKFKATAGTKNHLYILTKLDDGIGLVKLNKDTGKKDAELILKDKKPEYKVDDEYGVLYYKKDKKLIIGFDLRE